MMLWYLRIVHSVDFYGNSSVPTEDMMPHRCGIITVRNNRTTPVTLPHNNDEGMYLCSCIQVSNYSNSACVWLREKSCSCYNGLLCLSLFGIYVFSGRISCLHGEEFGDFDERTLFPE